MAYLQAWEVFIAVAEEKSFSAAAKRLSLSQPTISFHIDGLEKKFGCPLFVRTRRGVELTAYGESLYADTKDVGAILSRAEHTLQDLVRGASGHITVGAGTIPGEYILPALLADFLSSHPGVRISLFSADSQSVFRLWQAGSLSICVIGFQPQMAEKAHNIWNDEIIAVVSPQKNSSWRIHSPQDLYQYPLVLRHSTSGSMATVREALASAGIVWEKCRIAMEVTGNEALKNAVKAGAGIGFISKRAVEKELAEGTLLPLRLPGICIKREFYALFNTGVTMPAAAALRQYLLAQGDAGEAVDRKKPID